MEVLEYERAAMNGAPMPDGLSLEDMSAYQFLVLLYERYRRKQITREQAAEEKRRMLGELGKRKRSTAFESKLMLYHSRQTKAAESALNAYRKDRTLENADHLCNVLDGLERIDVCSGCEKKSE